MSELKPCVMCGSKHRDLMGYDFHKVSCSNDECPISHLALGKDQWQERIETETEKRITEIASKHATYRDKYYELLVNIKGDIDLFGRVMGSTKREIENALYEAENEGIKRMKDML